MPTSPRQSQPRRSYTNKARRRAGPRGADTLAGISRRLSRSLARATRDIRPSSAALCVALLVFVGVSAWSCSQFDSTARRTRPSPAPAAAPASGALYAAEPDIRVRVRQSVEEVKIDQPSQVTIRAVGGAVLATAHTPLVLRSGPAGISVAEGGSPPRDVGLGMPVEISIASGAPPIAGRPVHIRADGVEYPGSMIARPASDQGPTRLDLIAVMQIEEYLPGVVVKEMFPRWPVGAYQVQAVCARTYALFERERARAAGRLFDLDNTTLDQVYGGATFTPAIVEAVTSTRGSVITWQGKIIRAYYSSTCGGRSASAADVWPTTNGFEFNLAAPLQAAVREAYCEPARLYRWETTRSVDELSARLKAWGRNAGYPVKNISRLRTIEPEKLNVVQRPSRYRVTDDRGKTYSLSAEELRVACNTAADGFPAVTPDLRVNSGDLEFEIVGNGVRIRGRGFGHGVGMCQWCAKVMADRAIGWSRQIMTFYPGAEITKAY